MNHKEKTEAAIAESAVFTAEGASVDKIRDILFGVQMREYEKKFVHLEERLLKETADLKDEVRKSLGAFETFVKSELESLSSRLKKENEQRTAALTHLDEELSKGQRDTRQQLLDLQRNLTDEIRKKSEEAAASLKREAGELRTDKADRAALAALFAEVSLRLKDEFKIPGTGKG